MKNKALSVMLLVVLGCLWMSPAKATAEGREGHEGYRGRAVIVQPSWGWGSGWGWRPGWGWEPGWGWRSYWGGYYPPNYYSIDDRGKIKISDPNKSDQVYIDGA